jgi:hypothetical protein
MILDYNKISNLEFDGIDHNDYPDFCDAFISYGEYDDRVLTDEEIELLNEDGNFVYDRLMNYIF